MDAIRSRATEDDEGGEEASGRNVRDPENCIDTFGNLEINGFGEEPVRNLEPMVPRVKICLYGPRIEDGDLFKVVDLNVQIPHADIVLSIPPQN